MLRYNLPSDLMAYFGVNLWEFRKFWRSLTPDERHYYMTVYIPL